MGYMKFRSIKIITLMLAISLLADLDFSRTYIKDAAADRVDTLSPPLKCDDLLGVEHKDIGRIMLALQGNIMSITKGADIAALGRKIEKENTIFDPVDMQFFFNERKVLGNGFYSVMCRVWDNCQSGVSRTYYAVFSLEKNEDKGYPLYVYTQREYERYAGLSDRTGNFPERKRKDRVTIERYMRMNEGIIDKYIRDRIASGDFAEINERSKELGWDKRFPARKLPPCYWPKAYLGRMKSYLDSFLSHFGTSIDKAFEGKNIVFIKVDGDVYPVVTLRGRDIKVGSHTSPNAVYFFVGEDIFDLLNGNAVSIKADPVKVKEALDSLSLRFLHEVGVNYGLSFEVTGKGDKGNVSNDIFQAYCSYYLNEPVGSILSRYPGLKKLKYNTVDLDKINGRDYLASARDKLTTGKIIRMVKRAWASAGEDIGRPFTKGAQEAFRKIKEIDELRYEHDIPVTATEYFKIFCAQVFGEHEYNGIIEFVEWMSREAVDDKGDMKDFALEVFENRAFLDLYFTAQLLGGKSLQASRLTGQEFIYLCADQIFGRDQSRQKMCEIYGATWDGRDGGIRQVMMENVAAVVQTYRENGEYDKAISVADMLIAYQAHEKEINSGVKTDLGPAIKSWVERIERRTKNSGGKISPEDMEQLSRLAELSGDSIDGTAVLGSGPKTPFECEILDLKEKMLEEREKARMSERSTKADEISEMIKLAGMAGVEIPTHPDRRYTLIMTSEFYYGREIEEHRVKYGDRFELESVSAKDNDQFVQKVIDRAVGIEERAIALVPSTLTEEHLEKLSSQGIRFIRTDPDMLLQARADRDDARRSFQVNTYAAMLLARKIDDNTPKDSSVYRLLEFYIKSLFSLDNEIGPEEYVSAIIRGNLQVLLKGLLAYRPAEPYRMPQYDTVAASLISA